MKAVALLLTLLGIAGAARGEPASDEAPLDFALHLTRLKATLHAAGQDTTATIKQAGISSFERGMPTLQPGLLLGYAWIDLADPGPDPGLAPQGFFIAPAVRSEFYNSGRLQLTATAAYLYQRVRDSHAGQTVTLDWYQPQLDVDALWRLTARIGVRIGASYGRVDADEKLSSTINQTISLARDAVLGGRTGLELNLGNDGQIGFMLYQAVTDGIEIYFQRRF